MRRPVATVYQLKIVLEGIRPQIWRRGVVPADIRLSHLHDVFQITMGWTDSHLHAFTIGELEYSMPYEESDMEDERRVRLSSVVTAAKTPFQYQYDFGDDWQHAVQVEKIRPTAPDTLVPSCLGGNAPARPRTAAGSRAMPSSCGSSRTHGTRSMRRSGNGPGRDSTRKCSIKRR
jgi:hypothetical protein